MGFSKSSSNREVCSNTSLHQETGNISNKQPNLAPKAIRERRTKKPQSQQKEIKKYLETNDNGDTTTQNLWDAANSALRGKFRAMQSCHKKQETSQINNLTWHLKQLQKEEQNPKLVEGKKS